MPRTVTTEFSRKCYKSEGSSKIWSSEALEEGGRCGSDWETRMLEAKEKERAQIAGVVYSRVPVTFRS